MCLLTEGWWFRLCSLQRGVWRCSEQASVELVVMRQLTPFLIDACNRTNCGGGFARPDEKQSRGTDGDTLLKLDTSAGKQLRRIANLL